MSRYVSIPPRAFVSSTHTPESRPTCEVIVPASGPKDTGLLDADGTPIYRLSDAIPIGFVGKVNA